MTALDYCIAACGALALAFGGAAGIAFAAGRASVRPRYRRAGR